MDQMRDFVNTWMADLILARCVDRSDLKSKIEDKVMSAWLQKMGYDISDVSNIILKPTTIQAVNYITMDTKSGKPVVIEFQINMFGFKFGDANGLPTMATGSGTATAYDMDGNTLVRNNLTGICRMYVHLHSSYRRWQKIRFWTVQKVC